MVCLVDSNQVLSWLSISHVNSGVKNLVKKFVCKCNAGNRDEPPHLCERQLRVIGAELMKWCRMKQEMVKKETGLNEESKKMILLDY